MEVDVATRQPKSSPAPGRTSRAVVLLIGLAVAMSAVVACAAVQPAGRVESAPIEADRFQLVDAELRAATGVPAPAGGTEARIDRDSSRVTAGVTGPGQLRLGAVAEACVGWPTVRIEIDGGRQTVDVRVVNQRRYGSYPVGVPLGAGAHTVSLRMLDGRSGDQCRREIAVGFLAVGGPGDDAPSSGVPAVPSVRWPGPDDTGVPDDTSLTVHDGDLTVTTDGTVLDGLDIRGFLDVRASDVTVRRSIIRGREPGRTNLALLSAYGDHRNLTIEDVTLAPVVRSPYLDGLKGHHFTARRLDVSGVVDTAVVFGDDVTISDSWFHATTYFSPWPAQWDNQTHNDNLQIEGGAGIRVSGNTFEGAHNAAVMITQNVARSSGIVVSGNYLSGGGCTVNIDEKGRGLVDSVLTGNRFGRSRLDGCAVIAPGGSKPAMRDNLYEWSGDQVPLRRSR